MLTVIYETVVKAVKALANLDQRLARIEALLSEIREELRPPVAESLNLTAGEPEEQP